MDIRKIFITHTKAYTIFAALLCTTSVSFGVIRIQSVETRLYLAFNEKGRLYGEVRYGKKIVC